MDGRDALCDAGIKSMRSPARAECATINSMETAAVGPDTRNPPPPPVPPEKGAAAGTAKVHTVFESSLPESVLSRVIHLKDDIPCTDFLTTATSPTLISSPLRYLLTKVGER